MLRMSSTETGDERGEVARHSAQIERYSRGIEGMSPNPSEPSQTEVHLHIGAGHVLDDLSAIEPLAGEEWQWPGGWSQVWRGSVGAQ